MALTRTSEWQSWEASRILSAEISWGNKFLEAIITHNRRWDLRNFHVLLSAANCPAIVCLPSSHQTNVYHPSSVLRGHPLYKFRGWNITVSGHGVLALSTVGPARPCVHPLYNYFRGAHSVWCLPVSRSGGEDRSGLLSQLRRISAPILARQMNLMTGELEWFKWFIRLVAKLYFPEAWDIPIFIARKALRKRVLSWNSYGSWKRKIYRQCLPITAIFIF